METINDRTFKHCSPILLGVLCVAIVARSAAGAITLSDPTGRAIYQRNSANLANVVVAGTYSGRADRIEARAVTRTGYGGADTDWTPIVSAPRGGAFSATLPVPAGWYDIEVRQVKGNAVVETTAVQRVGIGEVFITAGQSNAGCFGSPKQSPDDDRVSAYNINTGSWQIANDPQPGVSAVSWGIGTGGSPWPKMGDLLAAKYNVPIGIVAVAVGGSGISQWQPNTSTDYYDNCLYAAISGLYKTGFRAILWHQGGDRQLLGHLGQPIRCVVKCASSRYREPTPIFRCPGAWPSPLGTPPPQPRTRPKSLQGNKRSLTARPACSLDRKPTTSITLAISPTRSTSTKRASTRTPYNGPMQLTPQASSLYRNRVRSRCWERRWRLCWPTFGEDTNNLGFLV